MKHYKKAVYIGLAALFLMFRTSVRASLAVDAKSAILLEPVTGAVLFEQNADEPLPPASVTKVMTIYLIYEAIADGRISLDDVVSVSAHAAKMGGSQIFLEPMEKQTVRDLLKAVVIASANDGAVALAEHICGNEETFVALMNKTAGELGLTATKFQNACGLDADGHYMSARDIAVLTRVLINKYPQVFDYSKTWMDTIIHTTARGSSEFGLTNTNKLIKWYSGATGLKTGSTGKALYCLAGTAFRDNMGLVAVVMAAPNPTTRFQEVMRMLDFGYANYRLAMGEAAGAPVGAVRVTKGVAETIDAVVGNQVCAVAPKTGSGALESRTVLAEQIDAPVTSGQKLGEIIYELAGKEVGRSDIIAADAVPKASFVDMIRKMSKDWF